VTLSKHLQDQIDDGFGATGTGDDQFDAVVGLMSMVEVLLGFRNPGAPANDPDVYSVENWIFGQDAAGHVEPSTGLRRRAARPKDKRPLDQRKVGVVDDGCKVGTADYVMKGGEDSIQERSGLYTRPMAVAYETEASHGTRAELGPYRKTDYLDLTELPRCELLYGRLPVTLAPTARHQLIVLALGGFLLEFARLQGGYAGVAPVDVVLADHSIVQPDVIYVSRERAAGIVRRRIEGAPDLIIEVLSPATARRDLGEKMRLYAESGVAEYWIVDPENETFEFLENKPGGLLVRVAEGGIRRSAVILGLELDVEAFWRDLPA
jgi:Uma2 family endonuclease